MNFLAHLTLSHFSADLQVGNFLGDLVKGKQVFRLPSPVVRGVELHRAIDAFTDRDEDVRALNGLLKPRHGRYASVITDVAMDYFLYLNWSHFGPEEFGQFCDRTYRNLHSRRDDVPERAARYLDGMTRDRWLRMYTTRAGMRQVFQRLLPRVSKPQLLAGVDDSLDEFAEEFNSTLLLLFPRLQALATTYRD